MKNKVFVKIKGMYADPYGIDIDENLEDPLLVKNAELVEIPKVNDLETEEKEESSKQQDDIEIINLGHYGIINSSEYVRYNELSNDGNKIKNTIKISGDEDGSVIVELTKKGNYSTHMIFNAGKKSTTSYETPFGSLLLGIYTRSIRIKREEDIITIKIDYSLDVNYNTVSDCNVEITISSKLEDE